MKKQIFILILAIIGIILTPIVLLSIDKINSNPNSNPMWEDYIENGIFTAQEEIYDGDITYSLDTYMWRDFMPISPPDGKPLIVITTVYAYNVEDFPLTTSIERLWIIDGINIKSVNATDEFSVEGAQYEMVLRDGPKWEPGIKIDVVVKLNVHSLIYYLKAVNQTIHATC